MSAEREHLRNHLTDGRWHDSCRWCLRRRVHGGNGMGEGGTDATSPALSDLEGLHAEVDRLCDEIEIVATALDLIARSGCDQAHNLLRLSAHLRRVLSVAPTGQATTDLRPE